jgi:hypothetical protein
MQTTTLSLPARIEFECFAPTNLQIDLYRKWRGWLGHFYAGLTPGATICRPYGTNTCSNNKHVLIMTIKQITFRTLHTKCRPRPADWPPGRLATSRSCYPCYLLPVSVLLPATNSLANRQRIPIREHHKYLSITFNNNSVENGF